MHNQQLLHNFINTLHLYSTLTKKTASFSEMDDRFISSLAETMIWKHVKITIHVINKMIHFYKHQ